MPPKLHINFFLLKKLRNNIYTIYNHNLETSRIAILNGLI